MKRTLPVRVEPIPGEALESWLAAIATRMDATWGDILDAVLPVSTHGIAGSYRESILTAGLSDGERDCISAATGMQSADLDAMTLSGRYSSRVITIEPVTRRARTPWGLVYRQRFCPLCMKAAPGRCKLEWRLPWISTCAEHRCFLVDTCPECAQLQRVAPDWFNRRMYPHPERCRRLVKGEPHTIRCMTRLSKAHADKLRQGHPVLTVQQTLCELLTRESIEAGVYSAAPVSADQLLIDVHALGNRILGATTPADLIELWGGRSTDHEVGLWRRRLGTNWNVDEAEDADEPADARVGMAAPAPWVGAGVTAALTVLLQSSFDLAGRALRTVTASAPMRSIRYPHGIPELGLVNLFEVLWE